MDRRHDAFWNLTPEDAFAALQSGPQGLPAEEAARRLEQSAAREPSRAAAHSSWPWLLLRQFASPIVLMLIAAACISIFVGDMVDAVIILSIVLASGVLGFWQEYGANRAVAQLADMVRVRAVVRRDGRAQEVLRSEVVPGDVVELSAGSMVPGDALVLQAGNLFVNQASLTGETFPVEKLTGATPADATLAERSNALFMGSFVVSGSGLAVVARTGADTELGSISRELRLRPPETEFERGVRRFGYLLLEMTLLLLVGIFACNVLLGRPAMDSLLFALALAVGMTPQLLPAIISINLSHGARRMAARKVVVKRLAAIENFGSMNVLCSDKTGTLTQGEIRLHGMYDAAGNDAPEVLRHAFLNAAFETGYQSPIDMALHALPDMSAVGWIKLDEQPYDFVRKRLSVLLEHDGERLQVTKGALSAVLDVCSEAADGDAAAPMASMRSAIDDLQARLGREGCRVLGVAVRRFATDEEPVISESDMRFLGLLALHDPPKPGVDKTIRSLKEMGVALKVITGDAMPVAGALAGQVGLDPTRMMSGRDLRDMSDEALLHQVDNVDVFAEVEPNQKERILLSLKKAGNVVGYLGDGINDASALHVADVGLSVDSAVDVAKEAADIVLLEKDLDVLQEGVCEGRATFANTLKYVFMATSANFGNMISMAGASLFLPFLPLLPMQVLLTNLLTDLPEMAIAHDRVDAEFLDRPRRWDIRFIRRFMFAFGLLSSVFDYLTFAVLLWIFNASEVTFRSGWFVESVFSAVLIVLVVRTRKSAWTSRPAPLLLGACLCVAAVSVALPFTPAAPVLGLTPLPATLILALAGIVGAYVLSAELFKRRFFRS